MKIFYSAESARGSRSSRGFSNDTTVKCFSSKIARDNYVDASINISCESILARDATKYATNYSLTGNGTNAPQPFTDQRWAIVNAAYSGQRDDDNDVDGFIGTLEVVGGASCVPNNCIVRNFYN